MPLNAKETLQCPLKVHTTIKSQHYTQANAVQLCECHPRHQKITSSNPGQATHLGSEFNPHHQCFSLPLHSPLSKLSKSIYIFKELLLKFRHQKHVHTRLKHFFLIH